MASLRIQIKCKGKRFLLAVKSVETSIKEVKELIVEKMDSHGIIVDIKALTLLIGAACPLDDEEMKIRDACSDMEKVLAVTPEDNIDIDQMSDKISFTTVAPNLGDISVPRPDSPTAPAMGVPQPLPPQQVFMMGHAPQDPSPPINFPYRILRKPQGLKDMKLAQVSGDCVFLSELVNEILTQEDCNVGEYRAAVYHHSGIPLTTDLVQQSTCELAQVLTGEAQHFYYLVLCQSTVDHQVLSKMDYLDGNQTHKVSYRNADYQIKADDNTCTVLEFKRKLYGKINVLYIYIYILS